MSADNRENDLETGGEGYESRTGQSHLPVDSDSKTVEDPIDAETADSDEQLERDDADAIDKSNIIEGSRTRGAGPQGSYTEPGDEEGLPVPQDGTSSGRQ